MVVLALYLESQLQFYNFLERVKKDVAAWTYVLSKEAVMRGITGKTNDRFSLFEAKHLLHKENFLSLSFYRKKALHIYSQKCHQKYTFPFPWTKTKTSKSLSVWNLADG